MPLGLFDEPVGHHRAEAALPDTADDHYEIQSCVGHGCAFSYGGIGAAPRPGRELHGAGRAADEGGRAEGGSGRATIAEEAGVRFVE
ncbi:hypothetical protein JCM4814A_52930 [Streptomyces phaeofaciens JCM 4814]